MFKVAEIRVDSVSIDGLTTERGDTSGLVTGIANANSIDKGGVFGASSADVGVISTVLAVDSTELGFKDESSE